MQTFIHGHSTPQMAGRFAKRINAKQIALTHFSPRYKGDDSEYSMRTMWALEDMAKDTSGLNGDNDVIAAWDLMNLPVTIKGSDGKAISNINTGSVTDSRSIDQE